MNNQEQTSLPNTQTLQHSTIQSHKSIYKIRPTNQSPNMLNVSVQLRRIKQYLKAEKQLERSRMLLSQISNDIGTYQQEIDKHKKQVLSQRIKNIKQRSKQRYEFNQKTNQDVHSLMKIRQIMKHKYEEKIKQQQQQYDYCYEKALNQRKKYRKPIDFNAIKQHQEKYLQIRARLKTENNQQNRKNQNSPSPVTNKISRSALLQMRSQKERQEKKKKQLLALYQKRNQFGNKVQILYKNNKLRTENPEQKQKRFQTKFAQIINRHNANNKMKKPPISVKVGQYEKGNIKQIRHVSRLQNISISQKIQKLNNMSNSYQSKYKNGKPEALNLLSLATLAKAQLYLNSFSD